MKQMTCAVTLALGLSAVTVPAVGADPVPVSEGVAKVSVTGAVPDQARRNKCATRREYRRVKVAGKPRHRSTMRQVRRIMDFNGKRQPRSLVYSGGQRWETRMYCHCGAKRPLRADDFVFVKYRNNRAYAKVGKP
ncbi:MAG TPA: hypothetical protein VK059_11980 [Nocardioidaceae bacterium]|nr:hypothetical protein [Nocardioidaceae bacterium]